MAPWWGHLAPSGATLITWPADLTTVNRSAHNSKAKQTLKVCGADKLILSPLSIL